MIPDCSGIHITHINALSGQKVEFFNAELGGTHINHWDLKG